MVVVVVVVVVEAVVVIIVVVVEVVVVVVVVVAVAPVVVVEVVVVVAVSTVVVVILELTSRKNRRLANLNPCGPVPDQSQHSSVWSIPIAMNIGVRRAAWTLVFLLTTTSTLVDSYSSGAVPSSCPDLDPSGHGASTATGVAPYTLELSKTDYEPGDVIQVTLRGTGGAQFKGFLVAGRRADGGSKDNIGVMSVDDSGNSKIICDDTLGNALTHTETAPKSSITFTWTAPSTAQGDVVIHYTVVRGGAPSTDNNRADYFQDLRSEVITGPVLATVKPPSFTKDAACGVTKGCYSNCVGDVCGWQATWQENGDVYDITLTSVFDGSDNKYMALGFSTSPAMGQASVVACITSNGQVTVHESYNTASYQNSALADPTGGVSIQQTSYNDSVLECSFSKAKLSTDPQRFNLTESWYLIAATGSTSGTTLIQHSPTSRFHTTEKIDLSVKTTDISVASKHTTPRVTTGTTVPPKVNFNKDPECGKTKGCYSDCDDGKCTLLFSWAPHNDSHFHFSMEAAYSDHEDLYVALGFSTKKKMDVASVIACTYISGVVDVYQSFNPGYYNVPLADPKEGISEIVGTIDAGVIKCTFTKIKTSNSNSKIYDLSQPWHLIAALGEAASGGLLLEHNNKNKYVASSIDFSDLSVDISLEEIDYPLIQAHACLMIIAWMLSGSIGLAIAKFFKKQWPDKTIFGLKVWFQIHRACMVLVFLMGSVAIVLVFLEIEGYSDIQGESYKKAHPILGLITTGLMVINPFMALFRCSPDHPQRWLFNWSHWAVGTSAHILAGVTITLGMYLPKSQMDKDLGLLVMLLYLIWHLIFGVTCSVLDYLGQREQRRVFSPSPGVELTTVPVTAPSVDVDHPAPPNSSHTAYLQGEKINSASHLVVDPLKSSEPPKSGAKKVMLLLHFVILTSMCAFLVFLVLEGED
ncbi:ferric-chelate reductase 1 [Elysia marginata]|uniref:Ferric-chelate reductase 1 n=1 Tax=Elysia marginata TaxID=1093978 RepID=A0AAV4JDS6_9GAST|nr:ferric-chelate reductase 1 [Elysia marginata]